MGNIGGNLLANLGGNLGCKLWTEKILNFFWGDSNPGQIDDFHLMRLFCLSIYIRNITYLETVIQRLKKKTDKPLCSSKRTVCCFGEGIQLNLLNLIQVSAILSGNQSGRQLANGLDILVIVVCPFELKQRAPAGFSLQILLCRF